MSIEESCSVLDEFKTQQFVFQNFGLSSSILNHFYECREKDLYTDVKIKVEDKIFSCHKILLDAACPFFASYFSFCKYQKDTDDMVVLNEVSAAAFGQLLNYIYTSELTITSETVVDILHCADFLHFKTIVKTCSGFLLQHMNYENCYKIHEIANQHRMEHLTLQAWNYILQNFENLAQTNDFCKIPGNVLIKILSSDFLKVSEEKVLLAAVEKWISYDNENRRAFLPELIKSIRLDNQTIMNVYPDVNLGSNFEKLEECSPRLKQVLVVIGRDTNQYNRDHTRYNILWYDPDYKRWETLTGFPFDRRYLFAATVVDNKIFLTGGVGTDLPFDDPNRLVYNECWEYNVRSSSWKESKPMKFSRFNHSSAGFLGCLYVVGGRGQQGKYFHADCARYDLKTDQWNSIASLRGVQGVANSALVPLDGRLFLLGGMYSFKTASNELDINTYKEGQYYDLEDGLWHELPALTRQIDQYKLHINSLDCLSVNGFLVCVDDNQGKYVHTYNPVTKTISKFIQCHGYHRYSGCAVFDNKLILIGGIENRFQPHDMVHYFDFTNPSQGWTMMPPLPVAMSNLVCVTIFK
ncbi:hypothetical protein SNE40_011009 [Patella caerulea]|uniref:BTB domain-containing protein n=1 Tax=Patella caerulea TaxID=87958 RepID=A0AAN8JVH6_PATCE